MTDTQIYLLLDTLSKSEEVYTGKKCAELLNMSISMFKKDISNVKRCLQPYDMELSGKSGKGNGYRVIIHDTEKYRQYMKNLKAISQSNIDLSLQENRVLHLTQIFLESGDWIKSNYLQEIMFVSATQLTKDFKLVRNLLGRYEIDLISRPHYGLKVKGEEYNIRLCLANVINKSVSLNEIVDIKSESNSLAFKDMEKIKNIIIERCKEFHYQLTSLTLNNLKVHIYIAYHRVLNQRDIILQEKMKSELLEDDVFALATAIVKSMQDEFKIQFYDDEVYYVTIHLSTKRVDSINNQSMQIVEKMIKSIKEQHNINFKNDLNFKIMLARHITPLLDRLKYNVPIKNPLLKEIKSSFLAPYELALSCASVINTEYQCQLTEDEIGYFALHIKVALGQATKANSKKKILLVCSTGRGSGQVLMYQLKKQYEEVIEKIEYCDVIQVKEFDLTQYDVVFTTMPLAGISQDIKKRVPIFLVNPLDIGFDKEEIKQCLQSSYAEISQVNKYFPKEMFFTDLSADSKEELIKLICSKIRGGYHLPENFEEAVLQRERLCQTNFGENVAFPHPGTVITSKSFISVTILKHPIKWGDGKVKMVLLSSFEKGFIKNNQEVFKVISGLISNKKYVNMLLTDPQYKTLLDIIKIIE